MCTLMFVLQIKYKSFLNIYSFCKNIFLIKLLFVKTYVLKLCCELSNLVLKVAEAVNLWYSLNELLEKKSMRVFILSNVEG